MSFSVCFVKIGSHLVARAGLTFNILLSRLAKRWSYRRVPLCLAGEWPLKTARVLGREFCFSWGRIMNREEGLREQEKSVSLIQMHFSPTEKNKMLGPFRRPLQGAGSFGTGRKSSFLLWVPGKFFSGSTSSASFPCVPGPASYPGRDTEGHLHLCGPWMGRHSSPPPL